ncbi:MAG: hypothetical protein ACFFCO_03885 [Promethearchaeota archaeon]
MDSLSALQKFFTSWMDQLWWSMRDRVGALSMIECWVESWHAASLEIGKLARADGSAPQEATAKTLETLGKTVQVEGNTLRVTQCPIWAQIKERGLEYAYRCEEFACTPLLDGLKDAIGATETTVETSLRLMHIEQARLEYKLSKLGKAATSDSKAQREKLEKELKQLPKHHYCLFKIK